VVTARQVIGAREIVTVVPVTHLPPRDSADAVEIPAVLKTHLGLDDLPSWVIVTETNNFLWPGPDLVNLRWPVPLWHFAAAFLRASARQNHPSEPRASANSDSANRMMSPGGY
jgi:hypothetical protein